MRWWVLKFENLAAHVKMGRVTVMMEVLVVFGSLDIAFFFIHGLRRHLEICFESEGFHIWMCVCVCVESGGWGWGYQEVSSDWSM